MATTMTEAQALVQLRSMVAWDSEPTLSSEEVDDLLSYARRVDEVDGTESWSLASAAAEGWRRKAGKCAGKFSFTTDGQIFSRAEMHAMCLEQMKHYRNQVISSVSQSRRPASDYEYVVGNRADVY